jgi:hypothetical protein
MKNIHLMPTDKPSSLVLETKNNNLFITTTKDFGTKIMKFQNIYITSDEKIKEGGWHFNLALNLVEKTTSFHNGLLCEKIILTTDQDLIKDGVQTIDDEFLEWFVKNPSCEYVKTDLVPVNEFGSEITVNSYGFDKFKYKIIIPQEEPKQETLEEAAERTYQKGLQDDIDLSFYDGVKLGAKWQQEKMYTEEEVGELVYKIMGEYANKKNIFFKGDLINNLFEQFKKK